MSTDPVVRESRALLSREKAFIVLGLSLIAGSVLLLVFGVSTTVQQQQRIGSMLERDAQSAAQAARTLSGNAHIQALALIRRMTGCTSTQTLPAGYNGGDICGGKRAGGCGFDADATRPIADMLEKACLASVLDPVAIENPRGAQAVAGLAARLGYPAAQDYSHENRIDAPGLSSIGSALDAPRVTQTP